MKRTIILFSLIFYSAALYSQKKPRNALQFPELIVNDIVPLDSTYFDGYNYGKVFNSQSFAKIEFRQGIKFNALLVKKMTLPKTSVYKNYSPYGNVYFEKYDKIFEKIPLEELKENIGEYNDTIVQLSSDSDFENLVVHQNPDTCEIKGLLFFDQWFFDEQAFQFTKKVLAYCPIRRYSSEQMEGDDKWLYRKTAYFVFPELKKRHLKKVEKRMKYLGRVEYEFSIENKQLFGNYENDIALYTEDLESPNWNSYARQKFRKLLIDRVMSTKSKACDFETNKVLSPDRLKKNLGYKQDEILITDTETGEDKIMKLETEVIKEEIKSVIFIEDWYLDIETMRMKKEVIGVAPVRFYEDYNSGQNKKKVAFVLYFDEDKRRN